MAPREAEGEAASQQSGGGRPCLRSVSPGAAQRKVREGDLERGPEWGHGGGRDGQQAV